MIVYPTLEILDGKCVSLKRGRLDKPEIWHVDPVKKAREFADTGAEWMHITDFNAINGDESNAELISEIIRSAGISVQLAGGFRTIERIDRWLDQGASRVVIATAAVKTPELVRRAARLHADQIVLSLDVYNGKILTEGWREETSFEVEDFLKSFNGVPLAAVIFTDVNADIEGLDVATSIFSNLAKTTRFPLIASGIVRAIDDVSVLKYAGHASGVVIGRALFSKTVDLAEALSVASAPTEKVAEFL